MDNFRWRKLFASGLLGAWGCDQLVSRTGVWRSTASSSATETSFCGDSAVVVGAEVAGSVVDVNCGCAGDECGVAFAAAEVLFTTFTTFEGGLLKSNSSSRFVAGSIGTSLSAGSAVT